MNLKQYQQVSLIILWLAIGLGVCFRFFQIATNQFFFYDEGLFLNHNIRFLHFVEDNPASNISVFGKYLSICATAALHQAKALWAFLANMRVFVLGLEAGYFLRIISALFGSLTIAMTFLFARRYFQSKEVGLLSAALVALMPSHIFYSRLALQEGLSTFLFLSGLYLYIFSSRRHIKTFLAGIVLALVFYVNYRMILIPIFVLFCELWISFAHKKRPDVLKFIYFCLSFAAMVIGIGALQKGANTNIVFAWMFYQSHLAEGTFKFFNLLSYPYYLFKLESILFGALFFANVFFLFKKDWPKLFPFALVMLMMIIFSFPQEKGVRYLAAAMPFMCMAVAAISFHWLYHRKSAQVSRLAMFCLIGLLGWHTVKAVEITQYHSDYGLVVKDLSERRGNPKLSTSQPLVMNLFTQSPKDAIGIAHHEDSLVALYSQGYNYLVLGPQAFVSYTEDEKRFTPKLKGYLGFISFAVKPIKAYVHYNDSMMERFVLEHNEDLKQSLSFLKLSKEKNFGELKVYSVPDCIQRMARMKKMLKEKRLQ